MQNPPFEIYLNKKLKKRSISSLYGLINEVSSIPTNYGCIGFSIFSYDDEEVLDYAAKTYKTEKDKVAKLRNVLKQGGPIDNLEEALGERIVQAVASEHPEVVQSATFDVYIPSEIPSEESGESRKHFDKRVETLRKFKEFLNEIDGRRVSLTLPHEELLGEVYRNKNIWFETLDDVSFLGADEPFEEEKKETADLKKKMPDVEEPTIKEWTKYQLLDLAARDEGWDLEVLRLTIVDINADVTLSEIEKALDKILKPVKDYVPKISLFL